MVSLMDKYKGNFEEVCKHYAKLLFNKGLLKKSSVDDFVQWMKKSEEYFGKNIASAELYHHAYAIYKKINNPDIKQHHILVASGKIGKGKCQPKGSKVLVGDGYFKNIEDIKLSDKVWSCDYEGNWKKAEVLAIHCFEDDIYSVRDRWDRELYKCSSLHQIPTIKHYTFKRFGKYAGTNTKLIQIPAKDVANKKGEYNKNNVTISCPPIDFWKERPKIDAYSLGVFLGDGCSSNNFMIESADLNIINSLKYSDEIINIYQNKGSKSKSYRFTKKGEFYSELKRLGLIGEKSGEKFIPKECLKSNIEYRYELLAGIIDTDGYIGKDNSCQITLKSKKLIQDLVFLVKSIGGYATLCPIKKVNSKTGIRGQYYKINVSFNEWDKIKLRSKFKRERLFKTNKNPRHKNYRVKKVGFGEVYGIEINSPSKLYVTDNFMVTHNTTILSQICALVDPTFCGERVYYVPNMFFKGMRGTKPGQAHLIDEGGNFFKSLNTMGKTSKLLGQYLQMMRSKRLLLAIAYDDYKRMNKEVKEKVDSLIVKIPNPKVPPPESFASFCLVPNDSKLSKLNDVILKKKLDVNIALTKIKPIYGKHKPDFPEINDLNEQKFNEWKDKNREAFERTFEEESKLFDLEKKEESDFDTAQFVPVSHYAKKVKLHPETIKRKVKRGELPGKFRLGKWMVNLRDETFLKEEGSCTSVGGNPILNNTSGASEDGAT